MELHSLSQWYTLLDEQSKNVEKFEDNIIYLYSKLNKPESDLYKPTMKGFYNNISFKNNIVAILKSLILSLSLFWAVTTLALWLYMLYSLHIEYKLAIRDFGLECLVKSILISLFLTSIISLFNLLSRYISISMIKKKLSKLESKIEPIISTLPPEYRTSERMQMIAKIYYTRRDVDPNIALEVCRDMMRQNATRYIESVLYDIDMNNKFLQSSSTINNVNNNTNSMNNYLPNDISSKTFNGSENSEYDLQQMIGLDDVKSQIEKLKNRIEYYGIAQNNGNHMTFFGSAGTGKTTVARIITKILYDLKMINKNQYVEISGDYLKSVNSQTVSAIIDYAIGGVLFIDEAYLLHDKNGSGAEATGILLKAMEDRRSEFVVILAGYEEQMTKLLSSNEGFSSRIKHNIYFPDYTEQEMFNIFISFISNYNNKSYKITEDAKNLLLNTFSLEKKSKSFGNARTVRNAADSIIDYYIDRSIHNNSNDYIITIDDVENYTNDRKNILQHELKNMSASNQFDESIIRLSELKSKLNVGSESPYTDLNNLVGLESFKQELELLESQKDFFNNTSNQRILLLGDNSCGKKTLTKIITGHLYKLGYIQENKYLDISAEFLKGSFVGHTNKRAEAIISYASGGVLLIRNINMLVQSDDSFSQEAFSAIITALTNNTNVTIIIADYASDYLNSIKHLFTITYNFPIYTHRQLHDIFIKKANIDNFTIDELASQNIFNYILKNNLTIKDIDSLYDKIKKTHIVNFNNNPNEDTKYIISSIDTDCIKIKEVIKLNFK